MSAPSRRWPRVRFRLWHLLALVTLLCGWLGYETNRARRNARIVGDLRSKGAEVIYFRRFTDQLWFERKAGVTNNLGHVVRWIKCPPPAPSWLVKLLGEQYFLEPAKIWIDCRDHGRPDLAQLNHFGALNQLVINEAADREVAILRRATQLKRLTIGASNYGGEITDESLSVIGSLTNLEQLTLQDPTISHDGLEKLIETLPDCVIEVRGERWVNPK